MAKLNFSYLILQEIRERKREKERQLSLNNVPFYSQDIKKRLCEICHIKH